MDSSHGSLSNTSTSLRQTLETELRGAETAVIFSEDDHLIASLPASVSISVLFLCPLMTPILPSCLLINWLFLIRLLRPVWQIWWWLHVADSSMILIFQIIQSFLLHTYLTSISFVCNLRGNLINLMQAFHKTKANSICNHEMGSFVCGFDLSI